MERPCSELPLCCYEPLCPSPPIMIHTRKVTPIKKLCDTLRAMQIPCQQNNKFAQDNKMGSLEEYIEALERVGELEPIYVPIACMYIQRLIKAGVALTANNTPRIMLVALIVAGKFVEDQSLMLSDWAWMSSCVGGGFTVRELNRMEMEFLTKLDFDLQLT